MPRVNPALLTVLVAISATAVPVSAQSTADGGGAPPAVAGFGGDLAIGEDEVLVGEGRSQARSGLVYVYRKGADGWAEAAQLSAAGAANGDGFGSALALDGGLLLVGATGQNDGKGAAFLFRRSAAGAWSPAGQLVAANGAENDGFGAAVALAGDVALVAAPARNDGTGAVYVFRRSGTTWTQEAELMATGGGQGERFGAALGVAGDLAVVGVPGRNERAGMALAFSRDASGQWTESAQIAANGLQRNDQFGARIVLANELAYISAPAHASGAGTVFAFRRDDESGQWRPAERLFPFATTGQSSGFGAGLAVDGRQLWVGAPSGGGAVYAHTRNDEGEWTGADRLTAQNVRGGLGSAVAVRGDVGAAAAGSADFGAGVVVVFERSGERWTEAATLMSPDERIASITGEMIRCSDEGRASQFDCGDVELVSFLNVHDIGGARGARMNDVWGWTDPTTRREYVIAGRVDGTSFVDITDPANPRYLGSLARTEGVPPSTWRDMKVYKDHVFIVADGARGHGMQVFDLARLRNVPDAPVEFTVDAHYDNVSSVHNIVVNTETGFAYAVGARDGGETCGGGLHMINIQDPKNPAFAGCFADPQTGRAGTGYSHDAQCVVYNGPDADYKGREICLGSNETMLSIADVTDKQNPKAVARASYPNVGYSHQGWFDEDQRYFYMDDELDELQGLVPRTRTIIWDLADLDDPQVASEFLGTTEASDHNLYIVGTTMYQSNYQSGLRVLDISDPTSPKEIAYFDTVPYGRNAAGFGGSWSNYPFFSSGNIAVTSGSEGLFILKKRDARPIS